MFIMQNVWLSCLAAVLDQTQLTLEQNISRLIKDIKIMPHNSQFEQNLCPTAALN